jgi:enoyl-CoA hydratase/carnithine racemase
MIVELHHLLTKIEQDNRVAVVVFDSADPDFFLAHYDIAADASPFEVLPAVPNPFRQGVEEKRCGDGSEEIWMELWLSQRERRPTR